MFVVQQIDQRIVEIVIVFDQRQIARIHRHRGIERHDWPQYRRHDAGVLMREMLGHPELHHQSWA